MKDKMMGRERKSYSVFESRLELNQIFLGSRPKVSMENTELWPLFSSGSAMPRNISYFLE